MKNQEIADKIIGRILSVRKYQNKTLTLEELKLFFVNLISPEVLVETLSLNPDIFKLADEKIYLVKSFASTSTGKVYECQFDWGEAMIQCGGHGIVIGKKDKSYTTAFFEAFPLNTFIRGEGEHIELAELSAWEKYQRIALCEKHEFERRGRDDDYGFCKHCDYFTKGVFKILTKCEICSEPTKDHKTGNKYWCTEHYYNLDWETEVKPSAPSYLGNFLEKNFKVNKKCREWIKKTKKVLTPEQVDYFCRAYENFNNSNQETDHLLFTCIYNIIITNPQTINKQDILNEINRILE